MSANNSDELRDTGLKRGDSERKKWRKAVNAELQAKETSSSFPTFYHYFRDTAAAVCMPSFF